MLRKFCTYLSQSNKVSVDKKRILKVLKPVNEALQFQKSMGRPSSVFTYNDLNHTVVEPGFLFPFTIA